jgi:hypothetical protein
MLKKRIYDAYEVWEDGTIVSYITGRPKTLKPEVTSKGYLRVSLYVDKQRIRKLVHVLVAEAFIPNHKDGNKQNPLVDNLEWHTCHENMQHARLMGTYNKAVESISKKVVQYTLSGTYINSFNSIREAQRNTGIQHSQISMVCRGVRKAAGGYIWKGVTHEVDRLL